MGCCSTKEQGEPAPVETLADNGETKAKTEAEAEAEAETKAEVEAEAVADEAQAAAEAPAAAEWKARAEAQAEVQAEEPQVVLTPEEPARRAALVEKMAALPEHLRLGVTLAGMRELLLQLPSDAVAQVNANIPLDKKGEPKYPKNDAENGYVNQYFLALWEAMDGLAVCERLHAQGSSHVGQATVFVSWFLDTPIATLLDALANFLKQQGLREEDTFFWVCDYVIRQTNVKTDLARLGDASAPSGTRCC